MSRRQRDDSDRHFGNDLGVGGKKNTPKKTASATRPLENRVDVPKLLHYFSTSWKSSTNDLNMSFIWLKTGEIRGTIDSVIVF